MLGEALAVCNYLYAHWSDFQRLRERLGRKRKREEVPVHEPEQELATAGDVTMGDESNMEVNEQASSSDGPVPPKHPPPRGLPPRAPVFLLFRWIRHRDGKHGRQSGFYTGCLEELKIALGEEVREWTMIGNEDTTIDNRFFKCSWEFWNKTTVKEFADELT